MPFLSRRPPEVPALPYDPRSPEGLAARWIQWVAAAGLDQSPIDDRTGANGYANQPADVWFLAGSRGGQVHRRVVVPAGRDLFFPVINWWSPADDAPDVSAAVQRMHGSVAVDGLPVAEPELIVTPQPFTVVGARFNDITLRSKPRQVVTCGLWTSVPALPLGEHVVHVVAGDGGGFTLDVRYELLVAEASQAAWATSPWG